MTVCEELINKIWIIKFMVIRRKNVIGKTNKKYIYKGYFYYAEFGNLNV